MQRACNSARNQEHGGYRSGYATGSQGRAGQLLSLYRRSVKHGSRLDPGVTKNLFGWNRRLFQEDDGTLLMPDIASSASMWLIYLWGGEVTLERARGVYVSEGDVGCWLKSYGVVSKVG
ncbi:hypothetical protein H112_04175 [Trichophyton rubrum D6]|nr:hypothetical protein H100_04179 [Trichophyton rubrum MR850]EZF42155.1 hypothetical protein H102_04167 [Trichophyton rubrum CBS 100081]EZF63373.1 hypothetical protein H104_04165 [Trichophyton rubrum CBS 289.86]EZF95378.1 hypothetical protein H113_04208 [Trichophyton rubrum MR1459]EZG06206.1 hypothetical protein H106_03991 [Trichophyton rubrum CBS 735.88]EZG16689.1 hypothetical protein H107_04295 [Trichophyton rubrum CBS 202.88]KDB33911.1 hypothetical protein H112_04175 [Trichophyton rubrum 